MQVDLCRDKAREPVPTSSYLIAREKPRKGLDHLGNIYLRFSRFFFFFFSFAGLVS